MHGPVGMHNLQRLPADLHSLLTAWPISVPGAICLALAAVIARRAVAKRRRSASPLGPIPYIVASLAVAVIGTVLAATAARASPFAYLVLAGEGAAGTLYVRGVNRLAAKGRRWPVFRTAMFMAGLTVVGLALVSPIATLINVSFPYHVIQHLLLMVTAPPLLALSAPMTLALQVTSRPAKQILLQVLHSRAFAAVTCPVTTWFLYYGVMFAFFLSPLLDFAMSHMVLMDALNIAFLLGACSFWWPTVGPDHNPRWRMTHGMRIINLLIGVPFESFLGIALMSGGTVASMYSRAGTHTGGGMIWAIGEVSAFVGTAIVTIQWARDDNRVAAREDRRTAARQRDALRRPNLAAPAGPSSSQSPRTAPGSAYEEAYRLRGVPVPVILADDHRG